MMKQNSAKFRQKNVYEPRHDKTNRMSVRPAKTQISLGICPVWSESSLSAWRKLGSLATHWADSEDSDQTGRMPRLIWVFAGRTLILLVLSCPGSYDKRYYNSNLIWYIVSCLVDELTSSDWRFASRVILWFELIHLICYHGNNVYVNPDVEVQSASFGCTTAW